MNHIGPSAFRRRGRLLAEWVQSLDLPRLKWTAIITYFGVYALLFVRVDRAVNRLLPMVPVAVRPEPLPPVWAVANLPKSVAMGLFSLGVALAVVAARVGVAAWTDITHS